jgi:hypothetical protein
MILLFPSKITEVANGDIKIFSHSLLVIVKLIMDKIILNKINSNQNNKN